MWVELDEYQAASRTGSRAFQAPQTKRVRTHDASAAAQLLAALDTPAGNPARDAPGF